MPEGDTVHAVARVLAPDLVNHRLLALELDQQLVLDHPLDRPDGPVVTACEALGKHLLIRFTPPPRTLRVHLGMKGSWHRYRPGEPWRYPPYKRRVVLRTADWLFVCFGPRDVELTAPHDFHRPRVGHLGPALLAPDFDLEAALARARARDFQSIAELLLDQTAASGIGNVYKSEVLFLEGLDPFTPARAIDDATLRRLYERARPLMQQNLEAGGMRITTRGAGLTERDRHWVYRRAGLPCWQCQTRIQSRLQGRQARMTYWCPACQRPPT